MSTPAQALARLAEVLDRMEVRYAIGGSVASSAHGTPRTTLDVDLVVDLRPEQIDEFAAELGNEFYVDPDQMRDAFRRGRAANLIHFKTAWKFDLFPLQPDPYSQTAIGRRIFREVRPNAGETVECAVTTPEDTILRKLQWYRAGGETSERQWTDLCGMIRAAGGQFDMIYLREWAASLGVTDLLERLLRDPTFPPPSQS